MKSKDLSFAQSFYKKWVQRSFPKISLTMAFFVLAQFSCWAVHDGLQEWLFKKVSGASRKLNQDRTCRRL